MDTYDDKIKPSEIIRGCSINRQSNCLDKIIYDFVEGKVRDMAMYDWNGDGKIDMFGK